MDICLPGNLAVGMVIFLILTLVNFLVITKGSERVAEVAARFSLDADRKSTRLNSSHVF